MVFKVPPFLFMVVAGVVVLAVLFVATGVEDVIGLVVEPVVLQDIDNPNKDKAITASRKYLTNFIYLS